MRPIKIGDFTLGKTIGSGSFATVRLAHHEKSDEVYAVKVLDKRKMNLKDYERQARRECKIMQSLDHPNIVKLTKILKSRACTYLFMEYVEGGELFQEIVNNTHLDEDKARIYFSQLTDAMVYAHERQIMHRDIKITDFGFGWLHEAEEEAKIMTTPCGTLKYMPPELLSHNGEGYCAAKVDVWSCGMVLFACLAGYVPYTCDTGDAAAILDQIVQRKEICFPEWLSMDVRDLLTKALEKEPEKRIDMKGLRDHKWTQAGGRIWTRFGKRGQEPSLAKGTPAMKEANRVPPIHIDGSFGLNGLEFTSPVTPGEKAFSTDREEKDEWWADGNEGNRESAVNDCHGN